MSKPESPYSAAVSLLLESTGFMAHINGRGLSSWVYLDHAPGRRGTERHPSGSRARIGRWSDDIGPDPRMSVAIPVTETNEAGFTAVSGTNTFRCDHCGQRINVSALTLLQLVAGSLLRDTRRGAQYIAVVQ